MTDYETRLTNLEKDMKLVTDSVGSLHRTLHGIDGEGGFIRKFDAFVTSWTTRENDKKVFDERIERGQNIIKAEVKEIRERRIFWIMTITVICTIIVTLLAVLTFEKAKGHTLLEHVSHSQVVQAQETQQDAVVGRR